MTKTANKPANAAFVTFNGMQVNIDVHNVSLETIIGDMVAAEHGAYGAHIRIAAKLNDLLPFDWFDIAPEEVSDNATAFRPHWKNVYAGFKAAGHSNPSVPGKRIKDYGRNLRAGLAPNGKSMADGSPLPANGEGAGDGANPAKRSDMLFAIEEGTRMYKRLSKSELPKVVEAMPHLVAFLGALGLDVRTVK